jgi:TonB family protein
MATMASVATGGSTFVWEDPGDSIMIQVSLDLIEKLGAAVHAGLGTGPRGVEIGGILLGRTLPGFGRSILIEDFELSPCEHLRGASYTLSPDDKAVLGTHLARHKARQVVGYFRSHTRPGLYLDLDDFAVFSRYFSEIWQVALLIRPSREGPATGGFFFWEEGDVNRRATYREFPFDRTLLATGDFPISGGQPALVPASRSAPVLLPMPKSKARRKLPSIPWVVVPLIAILFLIAGFFVSEKQEPAPAEVPVTMANPAAQPVVSQPPPQVAVAPPVSAPAEGNPVPVAAASAPVVGEPASIAAAPAPAAVKPAPAAEVKPKAAVKPKPRTAPKPLLKLASSPPTTVTRMPLREIEQPPALTTPAERLESKLPAFLHSKVGAPPPVADVTYEAPHPGVFRRAFRKIEGPEGDTDAFVPPSPTRKVAPMKPANAGPDTRPVDVKVFIDESGKVSRAQVLTKGSDFASAALTAARQWQFTPARKHDKAVSSELVLHFRF